jgi:hypothetical protein
MRACLDDEFRSNDMRRGTFMHQFVAFADDRGAQLEMRYLHYAQYILLDAMRSILQ